jgi:hypothetical protein
MGAPMAGGPRVTLAKCGYRGSGHHHRLVRLVRVVRLTRPTDHLTGPRLPAAPPAGPTNASRPLLTTLHPEAR